MFAIFNLIQGVSVGFEFVEDDEDFINYLVIDLFILRIMIGKPYG